MAISRMVESDKFARKTVDDIANLATEASAVPCDNILGLVLDILPYKESKTRSLELDNRTLAQYQTPFIDCEF